VQARCDGSVAGVIAIWWWTNDGDAGQGCWFGSVVVIAPGWRSVRLCDGRPEYLGFVVWVSMVVARNFLMERLFGFGYLLRFLLVCDQ